MYAGVERGDKGSASHLILPSLYLEIETLHQTKLFLFYLFFILIICLNTRLKSLRPLSIGYFIC